MRQLSRSGEHYFIDGREVSEPEWTAEYVRQEQELANEAASEESDNPLDE